MANKPIHTKKKIIQALHQNMGIVTKTCLQLGISRSTYYDYYKNDPAFAEACNDVSEIALDFAESKLHEQIDEGNITAIIFYLKTKGKHRGYIEAQRIINDPQEKTITIISEEEKAERLENAKKLLGKLKQ